MPSPNKILIVEDECILAENLRVYLSHRSSDVRVASDARQAMEILQSFTPDIVVLDYSLPDIDGLHTYTEIVHRQAPQAGCVMITGHPAENIAHDARARGIRYLLEKPFSLKGLRNMVDDCTDNNFRLPHGPESRNDTYHYSNFWRRLFGLLVVRCANICHAIAIRPVVFRDR